VKISVSRAYSVPNWDNEKEKTERALWEVVALALDTQPSAESTAARKKLDQDWKTDFDKTVVAMCDLLFPNRKEGFIYYDQLKPANSSRVSDGSKLKFIRVDVSTATTCLVKHFGMSKLPKGFLEMHGHLISQSKPSEISSDLPTKNYAEQNQSPKSQEKANETKASKKLKLLL
jgi:hypothetical protein